MAESQKPWQPDRNAELPIYFQIETHFEQQIFDQQLQPHDTLPSIPELVKAWNVSPLTVHKAFRRLKERGLIYSIVGSGTFVSPVDKQSFVGVLIHREVLAQATMTPTVLLNLQAIHEELAAAGFQDRLIIDYNPRRYGRRAALSPEAMVMIEQSSLQGLVGVVHNGSDALFDLLDRRSIPSVSWHQPAGGYDVAVELPREDFLKLALAHMRDRGVQDVAMIWLDVPQEIAKNRIDNLRMYEQCFRSADLPYHLDWIIGVEAPDAISGGDAFEYLWQQSPRPQGLIIMDDVVGRSVLMAATAARVRVPNELCIATMTNRNSPIVFPHTWARWEHDPHETARQAVNAITSLNRGESVPQMIPMRIRPITPDTNDAARRGITAATSRTFTSARQVLDGVC